MIRNFTPADIPDFPNIKILSYKKKNNTNKDYLLIERKPFVSCFINIDNLYGIFIQQFRPIINKTTLEIPMGKIESTDFSPINALKRELKEECSLFLDEKYILAKNTKRKAYRKILFEQYSIIEEKPNYISPGFSNSMQYPFVVELKTQSNNFLKDLQEDILFSQEQDLKVIIRPLDQKLIEELDGLSKYYLLDFLYQQSLSKQQTPLPPS